MKKILVPCDFSGPAINAYRFALKIAAKSKGVVHLIRVIELPVLHDTTLMPVLSVEEDFMRDLKIQSEKKFEKLLEKYETEGIKVRSEIVFGAVNRMITDYVREKKLDIIIMGTHGAKGVKEFFIGSNAEKIVRTSPVPVFVLKDFYQREISNIVFPNTFTAEDQQDLVSQITTMQSFFKAHLFLLWVNTPGNFTRDAVMQDKMNAFIKRYKIKNCSTHIYNDLDERSGIINFTEKNNGNLIAMGTHGRKGLAHLFNGSTAEEMVNRVTIPIVTCITK